MALILLGAGILAASGKIAGMVYSRNRSGPYVRAIGVPVNPNSVRQNVIRAAVGQLAPRWAGVLTALQRAAWEVYADTIVRTNRLGAQIKITGYNEYMRSNVIRLQSGLTVIDDGPVILTLPPQDATMSGTISEATQLVSVAFDDTLDWVDQDDGHMIVFVSKPHSAGSTFIGGPWRLAGTIDGDSTTPPTSPTTIAVPFPMAEGQVVATRARISEDDGRLSELFRDQDAVTA